MTKRTAGTIMAWFFATLILGWGFVLLDSNIVQGEPNQYGTAPIPGTRVLHLPAGKVGAYMAATLPGRPVNPSLPLPSNLALSVTSVSGGAPATVKRSVGYTYAASSPHANARRHVFSVRVPRNGDYRVTIRGGVELFAANQEMWLGHGAPVPGYLCFVLSGVLSAVFLVGRAQWKRRRASA